MLRIALGQMEIIPGNPRKNKETMLRFIEEARRQKAHMIVFPELCISGYMIGDLWEQEAYVRECIKMGDYFKKESHDITILFGNVATEKGRCNNDGRMRKYNAFYVAHKGEFLRPIGTERPFYIKTLAPNYRIFDEQRHFTALPCVATEEGRPLKDYIKPFFIEWEDKKIHIGPLICEDSWAGNYHTNPAECEGNGEEIDLFINLSGSPFSKGKNAKRLELFKNHLHSLQKPLLYVNSVGLQNNGKSICAFDGESTAYSLDQKVIQPFYAYEEGLAILHYDETTGCISEGPTITWQKTLTPLPEDDSLIGQVFTTLIYSIRKMCESCHIDKVIIGASGGIDSAVNSALYTYALGPDRVFLMNMPSRYNSQETKSMAHNLAARLGVPYATFPIEEGFQRTVEEINALSFKTPEGVEIPVQLSSFNEENIQARDRSSRVLAGVASAIGAAFTCNGNKSEISTGYATLYGDIAGFLCATGDLWKYEIYELAHYINESIFKKEVIPAETLTVVPSAELSSRQDVTQGKGDPLKYDYHDRLFQSFIEPWNRLCPEDILRAYKEETLSQLLDLPKEVSHYFASPKEFIEDLERWWNLFSGLAVAKRIQGPPIILVSRRAYGGDLKEAQMAPYYTDAYYELKKALLKNT